MVAQLLSHVSGWLERESERTERPVLLSGMAVCRTELVSVLVAAGLPRGGMCELVGTLVAGDDRVWVKVSGARVGWVEDPSAVDRAGEVVPVQLFGRESPQGQLWVVGFVWLQGGEPAWTYDGEHWPRFPWMGWGDRTGH